MSKDRRAAQRAHEVYERAMAALAQGRPVECVGGLQEALMLEPDFPMAWNNRGNVLYSLGNFFDAVLNFDRAIALEPGTAEFHSNRGAALIELGATELGKASYQRALDIKPKFAHALNNMGNALKLQGRMAEARDYFRKAVEAAPDYAEAHLHLSFAELELGNFEDGWREYEWRWRSGQLPPRGLALPEWAGERRQKVLLYSEQGHGDGLQFCRYAPLVARDYGCEVYLEVKPPLARLARTLPYVAGVVELGEAVPADVTHCAALMSLPRILGTRVETIPAEVPYFTVTAAARARWLPELDRLPRGLRVGLCWAGMARPGNPVASAVDARRSTALAGWAPLARQAGVGWVSLQLGEPAQQLRAPPLGMTVLDCSEDLHDFYDTASLISNLDLVISVDTAVVHVAGALGVPVWMLSRYDGCWRWMGKRPDSPWYPSLTQFRQPRPGDWAGLMDEVAARLAVFVDQHQQRSTAAA